MAGARSGACVTSRIVLLFWEHMSVGREFGDTLESCDWLMGRIAARRGLDLRVMLDVDHGDVASGNPDDTDCYAWLRRFGRDCPILHLKQASANKGGHWPFVEPHNSTGRIRQTNCSRRCAARRRSRHGALPRTGLREREPNAGRRSIISAGRSRTGSPISETGSAASRSADGKHKRRSAAAGVRRVLVRLLELGDRTVVIEHRSGRGKGYPSPRSGRSSRSWIRDIRRVQRARSWSASR